MLGQALVTKTRPLPAGGVGGWATERSEGARKESLIILS